MKVLIVSAFIDPEAVGEPRWCYDLAKGISDRVETVIISQTPVNRDKRVADHFPNSTVYEAPGWQLDWMDRRMKALIKPNYFKFLRFAERVIREKIDEREITCGHHFGPLGMRYPTPLRHSGIPYIIGPLGGSLPLPPGFVSRNSRDPWYYKLRDFDGIRFRHDPFLRSSYGNAEILVGAGDYVRDILSDVPMQRFMVHSQRIAPPSPVDIDTILAARRASDGPVRLLIAARLIFTKGVHYALKALAAAKDQMPDWELNILGDGVYRGELERLSTELGLSDHVHFRGHQPRADVDDFYRKADLFLFPTIREPSGTVIFEAMSWGVPMIAADYGGPATHVADGAGVRVPVSSPDIFVDEMAKAIVRLANAPDERARMGHEALRLAREKHSMTEMVDFFTSLYAHVGRSSEPKAVA